MTRSSSIRELRQAAAIDASAEWPVSQDEMLEHSAALLKSLLEDEDRLPSGRDRDPDVLMGRLPLSLPARGLPLDDVFARLDAVLRLTPSLSSWRFLNQLFGGREPSQRCWIRVEDERRWWAPGEVLVFDDSLEHEVHNDTAGVRVVLFIDFVRPCRWPVNWMNRLVLLAARASPLVRRAGRNQRSWERRYYGSKFQEKHQ